MDTVELDKLHWTQDLPPLRRQQTQEVRKAPGLQGVESGESGLRLLAPELKPFSSPSLRNTSSLCLPPGIIGQRSPFLTRSSRIRT